MQIAKEKWILFHSHGGGGGEQVRGGGDDCGLWWFVFEWARHDSAIALAGCI